MDAPSTFLTSTSNTAEVIVVAAGVVGVVVDIVVIVVDVPIIAWKTCVCAFTAASVNNVAAAPVFLTSTLKGCS